jgi:hypothetical protein
MFDRIKRLLALESVRGGGLVLALRVEPERNATGWPQTRCRISDFVAVQAARYRRSSVAPSLARNSDGPVCYRRCPGVGEIVGHWTKVQ